MKKQLQQTLKIAVLLNAKNEIIQLNKKIEMFKNFIRIKYFEILKMFFEITVDLIKNKIRKTINKFLQLNCIDNSENFFSNRSLLSLSINFVSMLNNFFLNFWKRDLNRKKSKKHWLLWNRKILFVKRSHCMKSINELFSIEFRKNMFLKRTIEKIECF